MQALYGYFIVMVAVANLCHPLGASLQNHNLLDHPSSICHQTTRLPDGLSSLEQPWRPFESALPSALCTLFENVMIVVSGRNVEHRLKKIEELGV